MGSEMCIRDSAWPCRRRVATSILGRDKRDRIRKKCRADRALDGSVWPRRSAHGLRLGPCGTWLCSAITPTSHSSTRVACARDHLHSSPCPLTLLTVMSCNGYEPMSVAISCRAAAMSCSAGVAIANHDSVDVGSRRLTRGPLRTRASSALMSHTTQSEPSASPGLGRVPYGHW